MNTEKKKHTAAWLLLIPLGMLAGILIIRLGFTLELKQAAQTLAENPDLGGHASGYSFFITVPVALLLMLIAVIVSVVKMISGARHNRSIAAGKRSKSPYDPEL